MNTRKDFLLIFLGAALFAGGLAVYLTPGLLAPAVPDEEAVMAAFEENSRDLSRVGGN